MNGTQGRIHYRIKAYEQHDQPQWNSVLLETLDAGYEKAEAEWEYGRTLSENHGKATWVRLEATAEFPFGYGTHTPDYLTLGDTTWQNSKQCSRAKRCVLRDEHFGRCVKGR